MSSFVEYRVEYCASKTDMTAFTFNFESLPDKCARLEREHASLDADYRAACEKLKGFVCGQDFGDGERFCYLDAAHWTPPYRQEGHLYAPKAKQ